MSDPPDSLPAMEEYEPWGDAAARHPHIHIERFDCAPARAVWIPEHQVILLDRRLDRAGRRTALAHEIAHIDLGHAPTGNAHLDRRMERDADRLAADRLLADLDELADALRWALSVEEAADMLGVEVAAVRRRVRGLTDEDKAYIQERIAHAPEGAA